MSKKKCKVVHIIPTLKMGGAETMVKDYCLLLDKEQFEVVVLVIDHRYHTSNEEQLKEAGIEVCYISELLYTNQQCNSFLRKLVRYLSRFYYLRKQLIRYNPDIVHMHLGLHGYSKVIPYGKISAKYYMTVHNVVDRYYSKNHSDGVRYREYKETKKFIDKHGLNLIALHDGLRDELKEYFVTDNVVTVNNGILMDRFNPKLYASEEKRRELNISQDAFVVGHIGRMNRQKNHALIVDVFIELVKRKHEAHLLLIGDGDLRQSIEKRIAEEKIESKVTILSNRSDIPELLNIMDVFLFPSLWEGYGNVMLEAQSMGCRCVVSDAVPDCVRISETVQVCQLTDSINQWVDAASGEHVHFASKVSDRADYDMKNCVKRLERLYEEGR